MALSDFIQALQQDDIVFSEPEKPSIRVIPPEKPQLRVIPPESYTVQPIQQSKTVVEQTPQPVTQSTVQPQAVQPKVIKFKLRQKSTQTSVQNNQPNTTQNVQSVEKSTVQQQVVKQPKVEQPKIVDQPIKSVQSEPVVIETVVETPQVEAYREPTDEELFNNTGTEYSKKSIWMDYFNQAKNSRKKNPIVDRMKVGRFTITPDNKVLLLPDYDIVGKDPDDVLKDKWF